MKGKARQGFEGFESKALKEGFDRMKAEKALRGKVHFEISLEPKFIHKESLQTNH